MKVFSKIIFAAALVAGLASCNKDYDLPPLTRPEFNIPENGQTTSLLELKDKTKEASEETPVNISEDLWVKAVVSADDRSGNLYKSFVIQDKTSSMTFLVDMSGVSNIYPRGQEIIFNLKGMCVSVYGGQQQIGHPDGYLYRTPKAIFDKMIHKNGWPCMKNVDIKKYNNFSEFTSSDVNAIVELSKVHFKEAGNGKVFAKKGDKFGTCQLKDSFGNEIEVRTSSYATFANNEIPVGTGKVTALLGKFRDKWQLTIVDFADLTDFDGVAVEEGGEVTPEQPEEKGIVYKQEFKTKEGVEKPWPEVTNCEFLDEGAEIETSGKFVTLRVSDGKNNVWFGAKHDNFIKFKNIDLKNNKKVSFKLGLGVGGFNDGQSQDLNALKFFVNGKEIEVPSKVIDKKDDSDKCHELEVKDIAVEGDKLELEFKAMESSEMGQRLFYVKVYGEEGGEVNPEKPVEPVAGTYYDQDFSTTTKVEKDGKYWPDFMTYVEKLKTPGKFATSGKFVSIRSVKDYGNNIWFGKGFENWIEFQEIDTKDAEKVIVSAEIAANLYNEGEENDLAALEVEVDGKRYQFPSTVKKDKDQTKVELTIPEEIATKDGKFTFRIVSNKDKNKTGLRLFRVKVKKA